MSDAADVTGETEPAHEWVTIPETARRLGLSERQTRRMAGRLPDEGRVRGEVHGQMIGRE